MPPDCTLARPRCSFGRLAGTARRSVCATSTRAARLPTGQAAALTPWSAGETLVEVPLVPPSIPGIRLFRALRAALHRHGGRIQVGEAVLRVEVQGRRVSVVVSSAAVRELRIRTDALVLATGASPAADSSPQPTATSRNPYWACRWRHPR